MLMKRCGVENDSPPSSMTSSTRRALNRRSSISRNLCSLPLSWQTQHSANSSQMWYPASLDSSEQAQPINSHFEWTATQTGTHGKKGRIWRTTHMKDTEVLRVDNVMRNVGQVGKAKKFLGHLCDNNRTLVALGQNLWGLCAAAIQSCNPIQTHKLRFRFGLAPTNKALKESGFETNLKQIMRDFPDFT